MASPAGEKPEHCSWSSLVGKTDTQERSSGQQEGSKWSDFTEWNTWHPGGRPEGWGRKARLPCGALASEWRKCDTLVQEF